MKTLPCLSLILLVSACSSPKPSKPAPSRGYLINVQTIAPSPPQFERVYTETMWNGIVAKVTVEKEDFIGLETTGELDGPDDKWVIFNTDNIAQEILDPHLRDTVQKFVNDAATIDAKYRSDLHCRYVDQDGNTWLLQNPRCKP